jgi:hypothetical protein
MMNACLETTHPEVLKLQIANLPELRFHEWTPISSQIAFYFQRHVFMRYPSSAFTAIELPSILELSDYLQCHEVDIFQALYQLKQLAYEYEVYGIDTPIRLKDKLPMKPARLNLDEKPYKTSEIPTPATVTW